MLCLCDSSVCQSPLSPVSLNIPDRDRNLIESSLCKAGSPASSCSSLQQLSCSSPHLLGKQALFCCVLAAAPPAPSPPSLLSAVFSFLLDPLLNCSSAIPPSPATAL
ncbi:hypothetical protein JZ751_018516 [Albula glossodonta]|uniref:Uncharacterized protein n=1 Tax=Albula glossodonta TaxID=121402 RepID=A0A8T2NP06_9TELE|nr:hypothetical protein JZ751_018516 [Albula glossodonta]